MTTILTAVGVVLALIFMVEPFSSLFIDIIDKLGMQVGDKYGLKDSVKTPALEQTVTVGSSGRTLTHLRPSGIASIDGNRCDVIAIEKCVDKDEDIQVCRVEGNRIYVERK